MTISLQACQAQRTLSAQKCADCFAVVAPKAALDADFGGTKSSQIYHLNGNHLRVTDVLCSLARLPLTCSERL